MDFFPTKKQTEEYLKSVFVEKGLSEIVKLHKAQASHEAKRELTQVGISTLIPFLSVNSAPRKELPLGKRAIGILKKFY